MKSQSTSKAGEMDWEKKFEEEFCKLATYEYEPTPIFIDKTKQVKAFIRTAINQAIAQERERIAENIKGITPKMPDELFDMVDEYDDYIIGYSEAKLDALNVITNNHEDHKE